MSRSQRAGPWQQEDNGRCPVTVADLQKYLRGLADAIGAAKGPSKELEEAAAALTPFGHYKMPAFADFLKRVEAKYGETGELPDGKPAKPPKQPKPPKPPKPTAAGLATTIKDLKDRLGRDEQLDRAGVTAEVNKFEGLKKTELENAVKGLGYQSKPKTKADALARIVEHLLAA